MWPTIVMDLEIISIWLVDQIVRVEENPPMGRGDPQECGKDLRGWRLLVQEQRGFPFKEWVVT